MKQSFGQFHDVGGINLEFRAPLKEKSQGHFLRTPEGLLLPREPKIIRELSLKSVRFLV